MNISRIHFCCANSFTFTQHVRFRNFQKLKIPFSKEFIALTRKDMETFRKDIIFHEIFVKFENEENDNKHILP